MPKKQPIQWLTRAEIQAATAESPEAALACSIEGWQQKKNASAEELRKACSHADVHEWPIGHKFCALCLRYNRYDAPNSHCECPLWAEDYGPCCEEYHIAYKALQKWLAHKAPIAPFRKAAGSLIAKMVGLQRKSK